MLRQMARAKRFNRWMADAVSPYVRGNTIELGAGIGNLAVLLKGCAERYIATDTDPEHLQQLAKIAGIETAQCDASSSNEMARFSGQFDTVICLNVLEHIPDETNTLANIRRMLKTDGLAIVLVPQGPRAFGSLDRVLEHQRRYTKNELRHKLEAAGFGIEKLAGFNRVTYPGWMLNARILRRRTLSAAQLWILDLFIPTLRRIDALLPWPPTSLIAVVRRNARD